MALDTIPRTAECASRRTPLCTGQVGGQGLNTSSEIQDLMSNPFTSVEKEGYLKAIQSKFNSTSQRQMARTLGIGRTTVNRWSREAGLIFRKHTVNETFFNELNEESAYILGLIYSDGNIAWNPEKSYNSLTITASAKDGSHLEKIRAIMASTKPLLYSPKTNSYRLIVVNKKICEKLMLLGVTPRKSLTVKFPEISGESLRHFIRGVIDGDGNIRYVARKRSPYFEITVASGSLEFCKGFVKAVKEAIGVEANIRKVSDNTHVIQYSCSRGEKLARYVYNDANVFLMRKYSEYRKRLEVEKNG